MTPETQLRGVSRSGVQNKSYRDFLFDGGRRTQPCRIHSKSVSLSTALFSSLGIYRAARVKTLITAIDPQAGASSTGCQISSCCCAPSLLLILCPPAENSFRDNDVDCIETRSFSQCELDRAKIQAVPAWYVLDFGGFIGISFTH